MCILLCYFAVNMRACMYVFVIQYVCKFKPLKHKQKIEAKNVYACQKINSLYVKSWLFTESVN